MLFRSVANFLYHQAKFLTSATGRANAPADQHWPVISALLHGFWQETHTVLPPKDCMGRIKQWVNYLRQLHPEAEVLWRSIREERSLHGIGALLQAQ